MRGSELTEVMAVVVDHLVNAQESTSGLKRAMETVVAMTGQFNGKDVTTYLEAFKDETLMRNVLEEKWLSVFPQVVMPSIHVDVLKMQAD